MEIVVVLKFLNRQSRILRQLRTRGPSNEINFKSIERADEQKCNVVPQEDKHEGLKIQ